MGRPAKRVRHRTAAYKPRRIYTRSNLKGFGVYEKGFSFTFSHNWDDWSTYTEEVKAEMAEEMRQRVAKVSKIVAEEAIKRCPHYSGALERAIRVSSPNISGLGSRGRVEFVVGVASDWKSPYDEMQLNAGKNTGWMSGPELATYIHEMYDTFIYNTKDGLERKRRKEAMSGVVVGSHFLSRAFTENREEIAAVFTTWRGRNTVGAGMNIQTVSADAINNLLQAARTKYANIKALQEVPF